jgi:hypothetical protein
LHGVPIIYTEDFAHDREVEKVRVVNPSVSQTACVRGSAGRLIADPAAMLPLSLGKAGMIELFAGFMLILSMVKIADHDNQSPLLWGIVTFLITAACISLIPIPFIRIGIAGLLVFVGMIGYKTIADR